MTHVSGLLTIPRLVPQNWSRAIGNATKRYRAWLHRQEVYNQTFRELARCSDRELSDISVARHDIPRIAKAAARKITTEQNQ